MADDNIKFVKNIKDNYRRLEESIVSQLSLYNQHHGTTTGSAREDIWLQLFEMIIPKKFVIEHSVFIIDSDGKISNEVDLAIVDNTYTPYIFHYGRLKYIPIEAVAAVIECKSTDGNAEALQGWHDDIIKLRTSRKSIARMATGMIVEGKLAGFKEDKSTQTSTRPIRIFCGYNTTAGTPKARELFDFVLIAKDGKDQKNPRNRIKISINDNGSLKEWYEELNHFGGTCPPSFDELSGYHLSNYQIQGEQGEVSLLSFNFQLNQLLMLINNPILFPHKVYAELFSKSGEGSPEEASQDDG